MKETYYKLNRDRVEELGISTEAKNPYLPIETLVQLGILEEVQDTKEDLPYTEEIENRKLQEESQGMSIKSRHLLDNMFGNPLEQVDSMIEGTKVEEGKAPLMTAAEFDNRVKKYLKKQEEKTLDMLNNNSKPFLDGIKPSDWLEERYYKARKACHVEITPNDFTIGKMFDLLVEELKKKGSL